MSLPAQFHRYTGLALLCASAAVFAAPTALKPDVDEDAAALVGELMFNADLLTSLDQLCPPARPRADWHAALPRLPARTTTPDLLDLSRRLGDDAGRRLLQETGGCASEEFREAYEESRENFDGLIERWQQRAP